ncbi:MAG TPA: hypothetical protein VF521_19130 [Pyrinomonadaceae bacterium]|jgi:hypothetical protein
MSQTEGVKGEEVSGYLFEQFVNLSRVLTGYERVELLGTGMAEIYYRAITGAYHEAVLRLLLEAKAIFEVYGERHPDFEQQVRARIFQSVEFSPIAKNIIQLWYLGSITTFDGPNPSATIISPDAYVNSLVWEAAGSHPAGAKYPGYGSWSLPPQPLGKR